MVCCDQKFVKEVNKIIFDFIWKGKDKVKRSVLVGDIEYGRLKAPHLYSMTETQRSMCCKKLASDELSSWKIILLHYLRKFALIVSAHPYCTRKSTCHAMPRHASSAR